MKLLDVEAEIHSRIEKDRNDPEIYNLIQKLAYGMLSRCKYMDKYEDLIEVSHLVAEDLYMKIYKGIDIHWIIGYISKAKMGYVRQFRKLTDPQVIDTDGNLQLEDNIITMSCAGSRNTHRAYNEVDLLESFDSMPTVIDKIIANSSRYNEFSSSYNNIYISVLLSFINDNWESPIFLDESEEYYFILIYNKVRNDLIESFTKDNDLIMESESLMQAFLLNEGEYGND